MPKAGIEPASQPLYGQHYHYAISAKTLNLPTDQATRSPQYTILISIEVSWVIAFNLFRDSHPTVRFPTYPTYSKALQLNFITHLPYQFVSHYQFNFMIGFYCSLTRGVFGIEHPNLSEVWESNPLSLTCNDYLLVLPFLQIKIKRTLCPLYPCIYYN